MKKFILSLALLCFAFSGYSQYHLQGTKVATLTSHDLKATFSSYSVFRMDANTLMNQLAARREPFQLALEIEGLRTIIATLSPTDVLTEDYFTTEATAQGLQRHHERPEVYTFAGKVDGNVQDAIALTVARDFIYGYFEKDGQEYFIEPASYFEPKARRNQFLMYKASDVRQKPALECGVVEMKEELKHLEKYQGGDDKGPGILCTALEVEFAVANDFRMAQRYGGYSAVVAHNIGLMNNSNVNFDNEFAQSLKFKIISQFVPSSSSSDPFPNTSDRDQLLSFFINWAQGGGFGTILYDIGHWRSPRDIFGPNGQITGATAQPALGVPSVCTNIRYTIFSETNLQTADNLRKTTSHEIGHSFGATHTTTGIMQQGISNATTWHPTSVSQINSGISTAICLSPFQCQFSQLISQPPSLDYICTTGDTWCHSFNELVCVGSFQVTTNDPNLEVTTTGKTICLKSLVYGTRISQLYVVPVDYCGNPMTEYNIVWDVHIDFDKCIGFSGGNTVIEREGTGHTTPEAYSLALTQTNDFLSIRDLGDAQRYKNIEVLDMSGRLIIRRQDAGALITMPLAGLPQGMLVVRVHSGPDALVSKVYHF